MNFVTSLPEFSVDSSQQRIYEHLKDILLAQGKKEETKNSLQEKGLLQNCVHTQSP